MSPQASWILQEEIVPRLYGAVPNSVLCVGAEDPQELIAEGITMAARMVDRLEKQGKLQSVTPGNVAYYTIQHLKSGRRSNGSRSVDVYGSTTQLSGASKLHSWNEVVAQSECGDEVFELQDVISQDNEDPAVRATRKMDWDEFLAGLSKMEVLVVDSLCEGTTLRQAGRSVGVSDSTMQNYRRRVATKIAEFMGVGILAEIQGRPMWKDNISAAAEKQACRATRVATA